MGNARPGPIGCLEYASKVFNDHRGISIKPYNVDILSTMGIRQTFVEDLVTISHKGVLRGLHFQAPPFEQAKLIWCISGKVFDVAVDLRKNESSYGSVSWFSIDSQKRNVLYIPSGFAHGYQVLEDDTIVAYKMSAVYSPSHEGGIRYDSVKVPWPIEPPILSEKDSRLPSLADLSGVI